MKALTRWICSYRSTMTSIINDQGIGQHDYSTVLLHYLDCHLLPLVLSAAVCLSSDFISRAIADFYPCPNSFTLRP